MLPQKKGGRGELGLVWSYSVLVRAGRPRNGGRKLVWVCVCAHVYVCACVRVCVCVCVCMCVCM